MKTLLTFLALFVIPFTGSYAESFSSSTNYVRSLSIATNEAIFITTLKQSGREPLLASVFRSNATTVLPVVWRDPVSIGGYHPIANESVQAFAGPMDLQFQHANVLMEFQRVATTNVHSLVFDSTNGVAITVPAGKTIAFLPPTSWYFADLSCTRSALITLSNSVTAIRDSLYGGESFSGPLTITVVAGSHDLGNEFIGGWLTYYLTEEVAALPNIGATAVPAGKSVIAVEKSQDLSHWGTVFFKPASSDQSAFYRFKVSR